MAPKANQVHYLMFPRVERRDAQGLFHRVEALPGPPK